MLAVFGRFISPALCGNVSRNLYNNALSWFLEELNEQYIDKTPERIHTYFHRKEVLESNKQILESKTLIAKFVHDERMNLLDSNGKPRKYIGHNTFEIQKTLDSLKKIYKPLKSEFERDSFQIFHNIFYPALHDCKKLNGNINDNWKKHMQSNLGKLFDENILSEEYLGIYINYQKCIETEWENYIIKLLDGFSGIRRHTEQISEQAVSRPETIAQRILTVLNGYSTLIPFSDNDLTKKLSDVQNIFYFFREYSYIKHHLEKVTSYTGPTLLYDYLFYYPWTKPAPLIIDHYVAQQQLESPRKLYKNESCEAKMASHAWTQAALDEAQNTFDKQADIYLPNISEPFDIKVYEFETFEQLIYLEIFFLCKQKIYMRECAYCHKHFIFQSSPFQYCNDCKSKNRKLSQDKYSESQKESHAALACKRLYDKLSQRIRRTNEPQRTDLCLIRSNDLPKLRALVRQCDSGQIPLENFLQEIDKIDDKIKTITENN